MSNLWIVIGIVGAIVALTISRGAGIGLMVLALILAVWGGL